MSTIRVAKASVVAAPPASSVIRVAKASVVSQGGSKIRVAKASVVSVGSLVANAGVAQTVNGLDTVVLDGSASTAGLGTILEWEWTQDTSFGGPAVTIANPDQRIASFLAPAVLYTGTKVRMRLRVRDSTGWSTYSTVLVTARRHRTFRILADGTLKAYRTVLTAPPVNAPPTAVIGPNLTITLGATATVGGTDTDVDGTVLSRTFTVVSGPQVPLFVGTGSTRTITPTLAGTYVLSKVVTDDKGLASAAATMTLTVLPPGFTLGVTQPDAANTGRDALGARGAFTGGVRTGTTTLSAAGEYLDIDFAGQLRITGSGVHVRFGRVRGQMLTNGAGYQLVYIAPGLTDVIVEFCDIYYGPAVGIENDQAALTATFVYSVNALQLNSGTVRRCNVHHACDTAQVVGNRVSMQGNYLHDNIHLLSDPNWNGNGSHDDGVQILSGDGHELIGNNVEGGYNGGLIVTPDVGAVTNLNLDRNWVGRGGATFNLTEKGRGPLTGLRITDNRCYGNSRLAGFDILLPPTTKAVAVITGNINLATGQAAAIHNGS